jgi:hypothetical protein
MKKFKTWLSMVTFIGVFLHLMWIFLYKIGTGVVPCDYSGLLSGWLWVSLFAVFYVIAD